MVISSVLKHFEWQHTLVSHYKQVKFSVTISILLIFYPDFVTSVFTTLIGLVRSAFCHCCYLLFSFTARSLNVEEHTLLAVINLS